MSWNVQKRRRKNSSDHGENMKDNDENWDAVEKVY